MSEYIFAASVHLMSWFAKWKWEERWSINLIFEFLLIRWTKYFCRESKNFVRHNLAPKSLRFEYLQKFHLLFEITLFASTGLGLLHVLIMYKKVCFISYSNGKPMAWVSRFQVSLLRLTCLLQTNECFLSDGPELAFVNCNDQAQFSDQGTPERFHQSWRLEQRQARKDRLRPVVGKLRQT